MWTSESNAGSVFDNFASAVGTAESAGTWQEDYEKCCETNNIVGCPYFKVSEAAPSSCKLINTAVDVSSWRAMIVAAGMKNSKIKEIVCHNVRLSKQHLTDLIVLMKVPELIVSIKLDYIEFVSDGEGEDASTLAGSLLPLLAEGGQLLTLSLKGCGLDSSFTGSFGDVLIAMTALEGLNLSENNITDDSLLDILKALPFCVVLRHMSLRKNPIAGRGLEGGVQDLVQGQPVGATGDAAMKNLQKVVTDKNKVIQAGNKARKKAGQEELPELPSPSERLITAGAENKVINRVFELLDFSNCSFDTSSMTSFVAAAVQACAEEGSCAAGASPLRMRVKGVDDAVVSALEGQNFADKLRVEC
mmetsp:Transcript_18647/g.34833  ORF Transcript_18647/g.34833 Transcript_18647/m.34833 type:complete len:360 (-) Transcript_18647:75-1154(-)